LILSGWRENEILATPVMLAAKFLTCAIFVYGLRLYACQSCIFVCFNLNSLVSCTEFKHLYAVQQLSKGISLCDLANSAWRGALFVRQAGDGIVFGRIYSGQLGWIL